MISGNVSLKYLKNPRELRVSDDPNQEGCLLCVEEPIPPQTRFQRQTVCLSLSRPVPEHHVSLEPRRSCPPRQERVAIGHSRQRFDCRSRTSVSNQSNLCLGCWFWATGREHVCPRPRARPQAKQAGTRRTEALLCPGTGSSGFHSSTKSTTTTTGEEREEMPGDCTPLGGGCTHEHTCHPPLSKGPSAGHSHGAAR